MYLWLTSCLTGLESTKQVNLTKAKQLNQSKQVKQQVKPQRDTSPYKVREYSKCRKKLTYQSSSQCTDNPTKNKNVFQTSTPFFVMTAAGPIDTASNTIRRHNKAVLTEEAVDFTKL